MSVLRCNQRLVRWAFSREQVSDRRERERWLESLQPTSHSRPKPRSARRPDLCSHVGCGSSVRIASLSPCGRAAGTTGEGWIAPVSSTIGRAKDHVPAIVEAWYPGEFGGRAIAETLFGDNNPAGRLTITFPATWESCQRSITRTRRGWGSMSTAMGSCCSRSGLA